MILKNDWKTARIDWIKPYKMSILPLDGEVGCTWTIWKSPSIMLAMVVSYLKAIEGGSVEVESDNRYFSFHRSYILRRSPVDNALIIIKTKQPRRNKQRGRRHDVSQFNRRTFGDYRDYRPRTTRVAICGNGDSNGS